LSYGGQDAIAPDELQTIQTPSVRERLEALGATMVTPDRATPEYLIRFMQAEIQKWQAAIKASGAAAE
jgi:hypothetical protein